jgi:hypothetical protein
MQHASCSLTPPRRIERRRTHTSSCIEASTVPDVRKMIVSMSIKRRYVASTGAFRS